MIMDVSVIIVSWNTKDLLKRCLQSINEQTKGITYEVIVIDNDSHDGTCEMLKEEFPKYHLIESKKNLGFVKGNNCAFKHARGRYILYLNPDMELLSNAIGEMKCFLDQKLEYGAVGCKLVYPNGSIQYVCARTFPTPFNQFCFLVALNRIFPNSKTFSTVEMRYWDHNDSREVDCLSGACILVRRRIIQWLSGFDEKIFMYADDVDLCFRIRKAGWKIQYLADHKIIHYSGASSKQHSKRYFSYGDSVPWDRFEPRRQKKKYRVGFRIR